MFNFLRKRPKFENVIVSPMSGEIDSIRAMPDEAFSECILGDGFVVIPTSGKIKSPVDGIISQVADTRHCWCIKSDDGLEILIHVGADTVNLKGQGFKSYVKSGKRVQIGDLIGSVDLKLVKEKGLSAHTAVVISNMNKIKNLNQKLSSNAKAGETIALEYKLKN